jgi:hypothetical protein
LSPDDSVEDQAGTLVLSQKLLRTVIRSVRNDVSLEDRVSPKSFLTEAKVVFVETLQSRSVPLGVPIRTTRMLLGIRIAAY